MKKITVISFIIIQSIVAYSQNLVENGSFETKNYCPGNFNQQQLNTVAGWWQATDGTPDYFNACSEKVGVPNNVFGIEKKLILYENDSYGNPLLVTIYYNGVLSDEIQFIYEYY